ncbi:cytochrome P450 2J1 [Biomphalaria pfeifferi]|uniref:Cytochrome P450 2J1 n=1 Tax=Biomphalaria pfeifferi TaxID=112525 RepID=A0AAD8FK58_BIOPF|nr:cytochrome P450 2J1 [Biomphalaria pfeifferi]
MKLFQVDGKTSHHFYVQEGDCDKPIQLLLSCASPTDTERELQLAVLEFVEAVTSFCQYISLKKKDNRGEYLYNFTFFVVVGEYLYNFTFFVVVGEYLYNFTFFVVVGCVLSFPLENCDVKKLHFRFLLDCRYDVEDQFKIFNQTKYFFETEREWIIPRFTLMAYSDKRIYRINESEVTNIKQSCPVKFPSEHITSRSQTWSQSQSNSVKITVMFVSLHMGSNELDNTMINFLKIRKHNFFIILQLGVYNTSKYDLSKNYLMSLKSFQEFILHEFYSKLCYNRCQKQPYSFTIGNNLKSYYNVTEQFGMSSNEARQYCEQNENGYLVSFETYDELEFIFQTFGKPGAIIHVGLTQHKRSLFPQWASSNPFTLNLGNNWEWDNDLDADYSNYSNGKRECFLLRSEKNDKENTSNVDNRYLKITYPFGEYKLSKTLTYVLFTLAWLVGIVLAAVPIVISSWKIYSTNGLCLALPFSSIRISGWEFTFVVYVGVNFVLFLLIAVGQVAIFVHIKRRKQFTSCLKNCRNRRLEDLAVARKLAFVAMSDFLCWFPIGIIGIFSMNGHNFDREVYAWFAVFVLPINSALNPVLYTIPTLYARCKQNI